MRVERWENGELVEVTEVPDPEPSVEDRLAAVEKRLDNATSVAVSGDAAKVRDALKGSG
jgi:hypothetical protein